MRVRARACVCVFTCSSMSRALLAPSLSSLSGEGKLRKDDTSGARGAEAGVETWREHHSETHGQGGAVGPGAWEWTPGAREWTPGARGETRENGMVVAHRISCLYSRAFILLFLLLLLLLILLVIFFLPLPIFLFLLLLLYTFFIRLLIVIIIIIVVDFWLTLVITAAKQTS